VARLSSEAESEAPIRVDADAIDTSARLVARNLEVISKIADRCKTYYTGAITTEMVTHWLLQFRHPTWVAHAITLLQHLHFIDEPQMLSLLKRAYEQIPDHHRTGATLSGIGRAYDSGARVGYGFAKSLGLTERELTALWREQAGVFTSILPAVILVDDNLSSGTQLERYFAEMTADFGGEREHFQEPLSQDQLSHARQMPLYILVAVELGDGKTRVIQAAARQRIAVTIFSGYEDHTKFLEYGNRLWTSAQEAADARKMISWTARQLFADKWS